MNLKRLVKWIATPLIAGALMYTCIKYRTPDAFVEARHNSGEIAYENCEFFDRNKDGAFEEADCRFLTFGIPESSPGIFSTYDPLPIRKVLEQKGFNVWRAEPKRSENAMVKGILRPVEGMSTFYRAELKDKEKVKTAYQTMENGGFFR